jgi:hypothetical protein
MTVVAPNAVFFCRLRHLVAAYRACVFCTINKQRATHDAQKGTRAVSTSGVQLSLRPCQWFETRMILLHVIVCVISCG